MSSTPARFVRLAKRYRFRSVSAPPPVRSQLPHRPQLNTGVVVRRLLDELEVIVGADARSARAGEDDDRQLPEYRVDG